jgi:LacI family transcriptional regulator
MAVTMMDIAKRLEISAATVSRVLSGKGTGYISSGTRERVLEAARAMGYRPNRVAQGLVSGKTKVFALWLRNSDAPFYAKMPRVLAELGMHAGYEMILSGYRDRGGETLPPGAEEYDINAWPVDGIIAADCPKRVEQYRQWNPVGGAPIVMVATDENPEVDSIAFDHEVGVEAAMQHLIKIGCQRIVHLTAWCSVSAVQRCRQKVYERVISEAGLAKRVSVAADETRATAREHVKKLWSEAKFDGLFCINDDVAIGAHRGLADIGVTVGKDVALVGCDDIETAGYMTPSLTTIQQPVEAMCTRAWEMLEQRWAEPKAPLQQERIMPTLVVRESTSQFGK